MKKTNFLQGLYSDEELTPAYLKDGRDNKTLFMKKLVTAVCKLLTSLNITEEKNKNPLFLLFYLDIAVKRPPEVRVSKILAGQEADKTNLLLQALAEAINLDVDNNEVVRKTLQSLGETNENEEPSRSRDHKDSERSERHRSKEDRSSKSHEREEPTSERKSSSKEDRSSKSHEREEPTSERKSSSKDASKVINKKTSIDF